jgi:hypothetical protein
MCATDVLRREQDVTLEMLDAPDALGRRLMLGGNVSPDTLDGFRIPYKTVVRYIGKCQMNELLSTSGLTLGAGSESGAPNFPAATRNRSQAHNLAVAGYLEEHANLIVCRCYHAWHRGRPTPR